MFGMSKHMKYFLIFIWFIFFFPLYLLMLRLAIEGAGTYFSEGYFKIWHFVFTGIW